MEHFQLCFIGYITVSFVSLHYGSGIHQWDVPLLDLQKMALVSWRPCGLGPNTDMTPLQLANTIELLRSAVLLFTRLSILLQYISIFIPNTRSKSFYSVQILIWTNFIFYISIFLLCFLNVAQEPKFGMMSFMGTASMVLVSF